jgi:CRISPR-associated endonuclease/helicase Cas3
MRTLVEQTRDNVAEWLVRLAYAATPAHESVAKAVARLSKEAQGRLKQDDTKLRRYTRELDAARNDLLWLVEHSPVVLMGGEELEQAKREWDLYPERPCILIGTQDMLLSRALNRGYGMSRYRWPMHFGLLNNDALWVLDETQLMGVGFETSAQLDGFRYKAEDSVVGTCPTWWMSATLDAQRLATVDHPQPDKGWPAIRLELADREQPKVHDRLHARKPLTLAPTKLNKETNKAYAPALAAFVKEKHVPDTLTLVVVNTVARAQEVFAALRKLGIDENCLALVHSRFRAADRAAQQAKLLADGDRIVLATQAVEAGVDVSARLLVTELAPWSSLVQRFGRCNRRGEFAKEAEIVWVDVQPKDENDDLALPYDAAELKAARDALKTLDNASPGLLEPITVPPRRVVRPVLRRKDLLDLFDTTPDLAGHDLDISRYIRDGEDTDVQVFWRNLRGEKPSRDEPEASRPELCRVSLPRFRDFLGDLKKERDKQKGQSAVLTAYTWDPLEERWDPATRVHAGSTYLLDTRAGGYSSELGWTGMVADPKPEASWVRPLPDETRNAPARGYDGNERSFLCFWVSLADHTRHVEEQTDALLNALTASGLLKELCVSALRTAARWHDIGKAHAAFEAMLVAGDESRRGTLWAKSAKNSGRCTRHHFRHELASALAWLQAGPPDQPERDLVAYLIAAHHGKVRLSIRSLPGEEPPSGSPPETRLARGILDGDEIPTKAFVALHLDAPSGQGPLKLDLGLMEMGFDPVRGPSWLARMIGLRDRLGPFPLAWLETLLRSADGRASAAEGALAEPADSSGVSSDMALRENAAPHDSTTVLSAGEQSLVADLVADGLSIQDKFRPEPLYKKTGKGYYASQTVEEMRQAKKASRSKRKP